MQSGEFIQMLFVSASDQYGDKYIEHLLEENGLKLYAY